MLHKWLKLKKEPFEHFLFLLWFKGLPLFSNFGFVFSGGRVSHVPALCWDKPLKLEPSRYFWLTQNSLTLPLHMQFGNVMLGYVALNKNLTEMALGLALTQENCLFLCSFPLRTTCSSRSSTRSRPSSWTPSTPCVAGFLKSSSSR